MRLVLVAAALVLAAPVLAAPPQVTGHSWLVENGTTGEVLLSHDARQRVAIASITKLMTVLLTLEHARLNDAVTVAPEAAEVGESSAGLKAGDRLTVRELLEAALIQSANDAADALAYYVGHGSETRFVAMMNARARQLGLRDTHFARPDGLDAPGHYSSARDVMFMARLLMHRPVVRQIVRMRAATISGARSTPGTTCSTATQGSSASRRAIRLRPGGPKSRRHAGAACRSTQRCSEARTARRGTPTWCSCSIGGSRAT